MSRQLESRKFAITRKLAIEVIRNTHSLTPLNFLSDTSPFFSERDKIVIQAVMELVLRTFGDVWRLLVFLVPGE